MKHSGEITIAVILLGLIASGCILSSIAGYSWKLDSQGLKVANPVQEAQATRVAMEANDQAAARQVERKAAQAAAPALALRNVLAALGIGLGALVLAVGLPLVAVAWAGKRATSIYPNSAGQYPVIVSKGWGWVTYHDPSRGLGPGAVYRVPTILDLVAGVIATWRGRPAPLPALTADYPPNASEPAMLQNSLAAQAVGVTAARNRWPEVQLGIGKISLSGGDNDPGTLSSTHTQYALPEVRLIQDPRAIEDFQRLLEAEGV